MQSLPIEIKSTFLIASLILIFFVLFIIMLVFVYRKRQTAFVIQKELDDANLKNIVLQKDLDLLQTLNHERQRISSDLHDEMGSSLSSIRMMAQLVKKNIHSEQEIKELDEIIESCTSLNGTMREMIWSLNPHNDSLPNFINHLKQYTFKFFEPTSIQIHFEQPDEESTIGLTSEFRHNVFLAVKEILNNIIKHADANKIEFIIELKQAELEIKICDDGKGLPEKASSGNGLLNIQKRIQSLNGQHSYVNSACGLAHMLKLPL